MNISKRLTELKNSRNMTTNKLANKAGISQSYLRDIELGLKNPTIEIMYYICDALGISLKTFFSEENEKINPILLSSIEKLSDSEQLKLADFINEINRSSKK